VWYDGGLLPPRPEALGDEPLKAEGGAILVGSKGTLMYDTYGLNSRLLPKALEETAVSDKVRLPRITTSHEVNWANAAKGQGTASTPFEYAARLTEVMLLGIVSLRAGGKIHYDAANMRVTNMAAANEFLTRENREGW
jgi:hypothetical protein